MIQLNRDQKIVLTGAGGWLGTELLELLLDEHGYEAVRNNVLCLGSRERTIELSDGTKIQISKLEDHAGTNDISGFVHLAFQTRDKTSILSSNDYTHTNINLTSQAIRLIESLKPKWIATVSSGAIFSSGTNELENNLQANPYGFTKRIEEALLLEVAQSLGSNLAIGRLWGAMGEFMPIKRVYAVSDFIYQASMNSKIEIRSPHQVWRKYCNARDFMNLLVTAAQSEKTTRFDSGGTLLEVGQLATMVATEIAPGISIKRPAESGAPDKYYPQNNDYEELCLKYGIATTPLTGLLKKTINSHQEQLRISSIEA